MITCVRACVCACACTYMPSGGRAGFRARVLACLLCLRTCVFVCLRAWVPAHIRACVRSCLLAGARACWRICSFVLACLRAYGLACCAWLDCACSLLACLLAGVRAGDLQAGMHGCLCAFVCVGLGSCVLTRVLACLRARVRARRRRRTFAFPVLANDNWFPYILDFQTCKACFDRARMFGFCCRPL